MSRTFRKKSSTFATRIAFYSAADAVSRWQERQENREAKATLHAESFKPIPVGRYTRDTPRSLHFLPRRGK